MYQRCWKSCTFFQTLKPIFYLEAVVDFPYTIRCCTGLRGQFLPIQFIFVTNSVFVPATEFLQLWMSSFLFYPFTHSPLWRIKVHQTVRSITACVALWFFCWQSSSLLWEAVLAFQQKPRKVVKSRTVKCNVTDRWVSAQEFAPGSLSE